MTLGLNWWLSATLGLMVLLWAAPRAWQRLELSRAKHRSMAGHSRWARRISRWIPGYAFDAAHALAADAAPPQVVAQRRQAMAVLSAQWQERFARGIAMTRGAKPAISDLQFTSAYRVPFPFSAWIGEALPPAYFVQASQGVSLTDLDGNTLYDLTGAYGVNLLGQDFYKRCIEEGARRVQALGPVLGLLHPIVADNARALRAISGLDEVSFHMSGTEAVMQAVRLARHHTGRSHVVRFAGAYHGWWDDVQPGPGNPLPAERTYTLAEMSQRTLTVLRQRDDIACVLVNPLQALHPNASAPGDSTLHGNGRRAHYDAPTHRAYAEWLQQLRTVCSQRGIVLILDEVFLGFRLAPRGAQQYFGVQADMVTYGKTLGGGLPVGVLCGRAALMKRFSEERPADLCFARGTFNSHPYVMGAMQVFLEQLQSPAVQALYAGLDETWGRRARALNSRLAEAGLPVRVAAMGTVWTVLYTQPSRYHWMLQFYLRLHGLALSWVGSGRFIFSLAYREEDFEAVAERFLAAARQMQADGWWWHDGHTTARDLQRRLLRELLAHGWRRWRGHTLGIGIGPVNGDAPDLRPQPAIAPSSGSTAPSSTA